MSAAMSPAEVVSILNDLFSRIDSLLEQFSMEKMKTIGDAYMVACGIPIAVDNHADNTFRFALAFALQIALDDLNEENGLSLRLRYGVYSGPVVIGSKKYIYDLWGDTVNAVSRMESHGMPDSIQVTESTYQIVKDFYHFECRGNIPKNGKGDLKT